MGGRLCALPANGPFSARRDVPHAARARVRPTSEQQTATLGFVREREVCDVPCRVFAEERRSESVPVAGVRARCVWVVRPAYDRARIETVEAARNAGGDCLTVL